MLLKTLTFFGEGHAAELSEEDFIDEEGAIRVIENFPLDIFVRMQGMKYHDMETMTAYYTMPYELTVPYLHANGLIRLKENSFREKDQFDVVALKDVLKKI